MSKRARQRDWIADRVAELSLADDLDAAIAASMYDTDAYLVRAFLSELEGRYAPGTHPENVGDPVIARPREL